MNDLNIRADFPIVASGAERVAERALLYIFVLAAALSVWAARYPPLGDLPQHAAQVTLALDLLRGESRWADIVTFNFFTPYLIGYGLIALLAQVFPIATAVKLVLSLSVLAFFWRPRRCGGASRRQRCWTGWCCPDSSASPSNGVF